MLVHIRWVAQAAAAGASSSGRRGAFSQFGCELGNPVQVNQNNTCFCLAVVALGF